jgi:hypothetical protein
MKGCKEKQGPCNCEKIMGAIVVIVAVVFLIKHFI